MTTRLYRDSTTGELWEGSLGAGKHFPHLIPVDDDAKPLAYVSIPAEKVAAVKSSKKPAAPALVPVERDESE